MKLKERDRGQNVRNFDTDDAVGCLRVMSDLPSIMAKPRAVRRAGEPQKTRWGPSMIRAW